MNQTFADHVADRGHFGIFQQCRIHLHHEAEEGNDTRVADGSDPRFLPVTEIYFTPRNLPKTRLLSLGSFRCTRR